MIARLRDSLRTLFRRNRFEREMDDEIRHHLALATEALVRAGHSRAEAERLARAGFGGVQGVKEEARASRGIRWADELRGDLRYAVRTLRQSPGYAAVAVATLALGIGANTTIFSVVDGVLLKSLPFPESDRLVRINFGYPLGAIWTYRAEAKSYTGVAGYTFGTEFNLYRDGIAERIRGRAVSVEFFSVLGVDVQRGRSFRTGEDGPGAAPVAILSDGLWRRRFGGDPGVVGSTVVIDGVSREVIGIAPAGFAFPQGGTEVWVPVDLDPAMRAHASVWGATGSTLIGRLAPGISMARANAEHRALITRVRDAFPWRMPDRFGQDPDNRVRELGAVDGDGVRDRLKLLLAAVGLVLLVACVNVANLNLTRIAAREREVAVRQALGGTRGRVVRQLLVEQLVLAGLGGALGAALALIGTPLLVRWLPADTPRLDRVAVDARVLAFTGVAALLAGLLAGLAALLRVPSATPAGLLGGGIRGASSGPRRGRLLGALVTTEVAFAVLLVVGAGLLVRSLVRLLAVEPGIRVDRLLTARVTPNPFWCKDEAGPCTCEDSSGTCRAFFPAVEQALGALPGIRGVALGSNLPLDGRQSMFPVDIEGHPVAPGQPAHLLGVHTVSPGYFATMGIPIVAGRAFEPTDRAETDPVVIVSRAMAERYWPGEPAVGKHLKMVWLPKFATVVGVAGDVRYEGLHERTPPRDFYLPIGQWSIGEVTAVVRSDLPPAALEPAVRQAIARVDPTAPVTEIQPMASIVRASTAPPRTTATLMGLFAAVGLALGAIGVYGVLSYGVAQRRREIGIRMAIGASASTVRSMVIRRALRLLGAGVVTGLAAAWLGASILEGFVYGIGVRDPLTFAAVPVLFGMVGLLASYLPARRATRVAPTEVMRED